MIDIKRTEPDYAQINCEHWEWDIIKQIVADSVTNYDSSVLDYLIPGDALDRYALLKRFNNDLQNLANPMQSFHRDDIRLLLIVADEFHRNNGEGTCTEQDQVLKRLMKFTAHNIFPMD